MKQKNRIGWLWWIIYLCILPALALAQRNNVGVGKVATNMMEPVSVVTDFVNTGCLLLGSAFVFASIVKYFEHRRSPLMVTMTTVVFLFIAGLVLLSLPLIAYLN